MTFFFEILHKNPILTCPYLVKNVNSVKTTLFYGHKSQKDALFVPLFHEKIPALMLIFYQKYVYSLKTHCSHTHISQKNVHSLKNSVLSCAFFSNFSWKTPAVVHMIGQKMSILSKLHSILGQKSQYDVLFSYFSQKKLLLLCPYFVKKRSFSKKK